MFVVHSVIGSIHEDVLFGRMTVKVKKDQRTALLRNLPNHIDLRVVLGLIEHSI
jgi:hypothetical protein